MIDLIPISRDITYMGGGLSKVVKKNYDDILGWYDYEGPRLLDPSTFFII